MSIKFLCVTLSHMSIRLGGVFYLILLFRVLRRFVVAEDDVEIRRAVGVQLGVRAAGVVGIPRDGIVRPREVEQRVHGGLVRGVGALVIRADKNAGVGDAVVAGNDALHQHEHWIKRACKRGGRGLTDIAVADVRAERHAAVVTGRAEVLASADTVCASALPLCSACAALALALSALSIPSNASLKGFIRIGSVPPHCGRL